MGWTFPFKVKQSVSCLLSHAINITHLIAIKSLNSSSHSWIHQVRLFDSDQWLSLKAVTLHVYYQTHSPGLLDKFKMKNTNTLTLSLTFIHKILPDTHTPTINISIGLTLLTTERAGHRKVKHYSLKEIFSYRHGWLGFVLTGCGWVSRRWELVIVMFS